MVNSFTLFVKYTLFDMTPQKMGEKIHNVSFASHSLAQWVAMKSVTLIVYFHVTILFIQWTLEKHQIQI